MCSLMFDNSTSLDNGTVCPSDDTDDVMTSSEVVTVVITGILGLIGMVLNIGVLTVVYKARLIKQDYRMLYYSAITTGDLMFATHSLFLTFNITFKQVYIFRISGFCTVLIAVFGLVAYQWSAMCIILLLVDLVWTVKSPFSNNQSRRILLSRAGCASTFILGVLMFVIPTLIWNDIPFDLPFCSIANLYGSHWDFYQHQAVVVLSILFVFMIAVSAILLKFIYRTHAVKDPDCTSFDKENRLHKIQHGDIQKNGKPAKNLGNVTTSVYVVECSSVSSSHGDDDLGSSDDVRKQATDGVVNSAFVGDNGCVSEKNGVTVPADKKTKNKAEPWDESIQESKREIHRREFIRACGNVAAFMLAYLGCCTPYYVMMFLGLGCGSQCSNDSPEARVFRALVATALYCLPVIDPILYTRRFKVFKQAAISVGRFCCFRRRFGAD